MMQQKELIYNHLDNSKSILLVLDACRYDSFLDNVYVLEGLRLRVSKVLSSGSRTKDWMLNTFTEPIDAVYVTANSWASLLFRGSNIFKAVDDVSARFWDGKFNTVRAENVNLAALKYLVRGEDKIIVHYLQPHPPFVTETWLRDSESPPHLTGTKIYELAVKSRKARKAFKRAYAENLKYVLKYVKRLVRVALRLEYRVVITSDHSDLLGSYAPISMLRRFFRKNLLKFLRNWLPYAIGYYRVVGHPCGWGGRELYEVPWVEVW